MPYMIAEEQLALARALDDAALIPSGEIRGLVHIARALQAVPDPEIDPEFARRLEARLLTDGFDELSARRTRAASPMPNVAVSPNLTAAVHTLPRGRFVVRKAVAAAVAAAMLFALPVVASGSSLPGSPFYGVKTAMERLELAAAQGPVADGFVYLKHAARRLDEVDQAISIGRDAVVASTLRRYDAAITRGTRLILSATDDPALLERLARELARGTGWLSQLLTVAPSVVAPAIIDSINGGRALSLKVERILALDENASAVPAPRVPAGEVALPGAGTLPMDVSPGAASPGTGTTSPAVVPDGDDKNDTGTGTRGARSSCLGLIVRDPLDPVKSVCAAVTSIDEGSGESHGANTPGAAGCPSATTCAMFVLDTYRWATSGGVATIPFVVNPVQPWVPASDAVAAAKRAAGAWSDAASSVRFGYRGTTTAAPTLGDGVNQIGWGNPGGLNRVARANILRVGNRVIEADIVLTATLPWGSSNVINRYDIASVLVHELGHWLGIDHMDSKAASELSMFAQPQPGQTKYATLGLGDVRAVRAAYPCACSEPAIADDTPAPEGTEEPAGQSRTVATQPAASGSSAKRARSGGSGDAKDGTENGKGKAKQKAPRKTNKA